MNKILGAVILLNMLVPNVSYAWPATNEDCLSVDIAEQKRLDALMAKNRVAIENSTTLVNSTQASIADLSSKIADLKSQIATISERYDEVKGELRRGSAGIVEFQEFVENFESTISVLNSRTQNLDTKDSFYDLLKPPYENMTDYEVFYITELFYLLAKQGDSKLGERLSLADALGEDPIRALNDDMHKELGDLSLGWSDEDEKIVGDEVKLQAAKTALPPLEIQFAKLSDALPGYQANLDRYKEQQNTLVEASSNSLFDQMKCMEEQNRRN